MMTTLFLSLILGCQQECTECETVATPCPDGQRCTDESDDGRVQLGTLNFPIGDGPTEIWKGPELVGVGFRLNGVEDIVMFTQDLDQLPLPPLGIGPCVAPALQTNIYPTYLSPYHPPQGNGADELTFKRLEYCDGSVLKTCGKTDCFPSAAKFLDPDTGVFQTIGRRLGQPATVVSAPRNWKRAQGVVPLFGEFSLVGCQAATLPYPLASSHADRAVPTGDSVDVGWEFVGLINGPVSLQSALVVFKKPTKEVGNGISHADMALADTNTNGSGGDEWCAYVNSQCPLDGQGRATCWMSLIGFSFP